MVKLTGNIIRILLVNVLLTFNIQIVCSQIHGMVVDAASGEPVAMATINYDKYSNYTKADKKGSFKIEKRIGGRLIITSVGYTPIMVLIKKGTPDSVVFRMEPVTQALDEVIIQSSNKKKYRRKDNPAVELMRKVIARKKTSDIHQYESFQYTNYQKITAGFNDLQPQDLKRGIFHNRPWLLNYLEVNRYNSKLSMPLFLEETVTEKYYRKHPRFEKDNIVAHRTKGLNKLFQTGNIINTIISEYFTDIDIYDDQIRLLQHSFTSPTGRDAILFYHFYITDTLSIDNNLCYQVDFTPSNQQDFGFRGQLFILADSSYQVKRCDLTFPKATDVNWIENMRCIQEFRKQGNNEWVLSRDDMFAEILVTKYTAKGIVMRNTRRIDYSFNHLSESFDVSDSIDNYRKYLDKEKKWNN